MRGDARGFAADDANRLAARRQFPAHQLFHGERVSDVVCEWRQVIEPVGVRHELVVLHVLGDFFIATVQVTDVRSCLGDRFAIEFEHEHCAHEAQDAMRGRMGRPHVQDHFFANVPQGLADSRVPRGDAGNGIRRFDFARRKSHMATLRLCSREAARAQVQSRVCGEDVP